MHQSFWILTGPTASGKTEVAFHLAKEIGAEIISADSMQVYRGMDIGTAKPPLELRREVPHHLIDIVDPWESYSVGRYILDAREAMSRVEERGRRCLVVGGTGLYVKAIREGLFRGPDADWALREELAAVAEDKGSAYLHGVLQGIDPVSAGRIHEKDLRRIIRALEVYQKTGKAISLLQREWGTIREDSILVVLSLKREELNRRVEERVQRMMKEGLVEEVRHLLSSPKGLSKQAREALGYKEVLDYLSGCISLAEAEELIKRNTRRFAKRQMTWFRSFAGARWLEIKEGEDVQGLTKRVMEVFIG
ncbi:MAG TPA: tRNA (adenosine(37)-N6)-dimethylallyltransferase MiaA [Candidatus Hypogeohydataceae bacterium YC38]|nr:tRNA (adenosine(37)-N6)-dimethylallyltransferase MiaA [Candidatus Brocadiales bacterium]